MPNYSIKPATLRQTDLSGQTSGRWMIIRRDESDRAKIHPRWICRCSCGTERSVVAVNLVNGKSQSCGCSDLAEHEAKSRIKDVDGAEYGKIILCQDCQKETPKRGTNSKLCIDCSDERKRVRQLKWSNDHRAPSHKIKEYGANQKSRKIEYGKSVSVINRWSPDQLFAEPHNMVWVRRFSVPFTYAMSKNHGAAFSRRGHVYLRKETVDARQLLMDEIAIALNGAPIVEGKLWVEMLIEKPDHRGDAINILDHAADAIKKAIDLDDRWFCVRSLDWSIVKDEPRILIGIGQDISSPVRACSYCGRILDYSFFSKSKNIKGGVSRECRECVSGSKRFSVPASPDARPDPLPV